MSFNVVTGVYTPPAGATSAVTGQVIQSGVWNTIHADLSAALTGLAQGTQPILTQMSFHNAIARNGSFDVWQRGAGGSASITLTGAATVYTSDGWYLVSNANQTLAATQQAALVSGSRSSGRFQRNSGSTGVGIITLGFPLDIDECQSMQGKLNALSWVMSTGANWSPTVVVANVFTGTGTPVKQVNGTYAGQATPISTTIAIGANSSATITISGSRIGSSIQQAEVQFSWTPSGTAGAADYIQFDDVQFEPNPVSSPYDQIPFLVELTLSRRHYQKTFAYSVAPAQAAGTLAAMEAIVPVANSAVGVIWAFGPMRATPVITTYNPASASSAWQNMTGAATVAVTVDANTLSSERAFFSSATVAAASSLLAIHAQADAGI